MENLSNSSQATTHWKIEHSPEKGINMCSSTWHVVVNTLIAKSFYPYVDKNVE